MSEQQIFSIMSEQILSYADICESTLLTLILVIGHEYDMHNYTHKLAAYIL